MTFNYVDNILLEETQKRIKQSYFGEKVLAYTIVDDGFVLPYRGTLPYEITGGVITKDKKFIQQSSVNETIGGSYSFEEEEIKKSDKTVIYMGMFLPVWGHCLTDCIKKIWFLYTQEGMALLNQGAELIYVNIYETLPKPFQDFLELCIPNYKIVSVREITQYKKIYIPDDSLFRDAQGILYYTKQHSDMLKQVLQNFISCKIQTYEKIYFSRSAIHVGKDYGEKRIEDVFKYLGYIIIYPEKLSFQEQVTLLQHCTHFASTEGSVSHNSMFCRPGTKVCIIRKCSYLNEYQFMINQMASLDVTYIDSHLSICIDKSNKWLGPFFLYVNNNLLRYAGIPHVFNSFSMHQFKKYVNRGYWLHKNDMEIPEFYAMRLFDEIYTSYFCKNWIKRVARFILLHGNLSILVPLYKKIMKCL